MVVKCSNKHCYISGESLNENNISYEHIIPNALGGHLKCPDLICKKINNDLFATLDALLTNSIELSQLINFKRDRGEQPKIIGTTLEGLKYSIGTDFTGTLLPLKPFIVTDKNGNKFQKFPLSQKEEIISSKLRKNPQLTREEIERGFRHSFEEKKEQINFKNGLSIFPNKDPFRAIAKIATNYAVLNEISITHFPELIKFIKGSEDLSRIKLGYYYPSKEDLIYQMDKSEISHLLYLKGSEKEKILYCYIELFNTHCFVIILDQNYRGQSIENSYSWDLLNAKELKKPISMNLKRDFLLKRSYMVYDGVEVDYTERLKRVARICGLTIKPQGTTTQHEVD